MIATLIKLERLNEARQLFNETFKHLSAEITRPDIQLAARNRFLYVLLLSLLEKLEPLRAHELKQRIMVVERASQPGSDDMADLLLTEDKDQWFATLQQKLQAGWLPDYNLYLWSLPQWSIWQQLSVVQQSLLQQQLTINRRRVLVAGK